MLAFERQPLHGQDQQAKGRLQFTETDQHQEQAIKRRKPRRSGVLNGFIVQGSYVNHHTALHAADPRLKLLVLCLFSVVLFFLNTWFGMIAATVAVVVCAVISRMNPTLIIQGIKPTVVIIVVMFVSHGLSFHAPIPLIGSFGVNPAGALEGLFFIVRLVLLITCTLIFTFTTSVTQLTESLGSTLRFLRVFKIPVDDLVTMLSIALRFIPVCAQELQKIKFAQAMRGVNFETGSVKARLQAWIPVFIPVFVNLFRRSYDIAQSMDARCYQGEGRTQLYEFHAPLPEIVLTGVVCVALVAFAFFW